MFQHCIQNREQFSHAGRECHFGGFACVTKATVEGLDDRIVPGGHERTHVHHGPYVRAASAHTRPPAPEPALFGERRYTDEGCDLATIQLSQFRQTRQQRLRHHGTHPRHALQQIVLLPPDGTLLDALLQIAIHAGQLRLQPGHMGIDAFAHPFRRPRAALLLGNEHLEQLPAPRQQCGQFLRARLWQRAGRRPYPLGKLGQNPGIQPINDKFLQLIAPSLVLTALMTQPATIVPALPLVMPKLLLGALDLFTILVELFSVLRESSLTGPQLFVF